MLTIVFADISSEDEKCDFSKYIMPFNGVEIDQTPRAGLGEKNNVV